MEHICFDLCKLVLLGKGRQMSIVRPIGMDKSDAYFDLERRLFQFYEMQLESCLLCSTIDYLAPKD